MEQKALMCPKLKVSFLGVCNRCSIHCEVNMYEIVRQHQYFEVTKYFKEMSVLVAILIFH